MKHFIQISDCHIDDNPQSMGVDTHQNLADVVQKITHIKSDALLISGDLAHNGSAKSYQTLKRILAPVQTAIFVISGNHDDANHLAQVFKKNLFSTFTLNPWEIIGIDSVQPHKTSGYLTQHTLIDLDQRLKNSQADYILLVLHHPVVSMRSNWDDALSLENPNALFEVLERYPNVQAVLFGHAHQAAEFKHRNLRIISCPSTALQFNDERRIGFNHYTLHDDGRLDYNTQWI